jgi:uncharacterized protein YndB with AHSA1/START domain
MKSEQRSVVHSTFSIERTYDAARERVYQAFADKSAKAKWFAGPADWTKGREEMDFRVGGREVVSGGPKDGPAHTFDARYLEIVPNERIIYSYDMYVGDTKLSVSLATIELKAEGKKTRLVITEQGAFLDGHEDPKLRETGTRQLLEALGRSLSS